MNSQNQQNQTPNIFVINGHNPNKVGSSAESVHPLNSRRENTPKILDYEISIEELATYRKIRRNKRKQFSNFRRYRFLFAFYAVWVLLFFSAFIGGYLFLASQSIIINGHSLVFPNLLQIHWKIWVPLSIYFLLPTILITLRFFMLLLTPKHYFNWNQQDELYFQRHKNTTKNYLVFLWVLFFLPFVVFWIIRYFFRKHK